ncbi:MAG: hypothetical protein KF691_10300 [Phycisphaeraceae bacterium]|nr:hypothetical protein [Phycisphaeraceae bacterium]
MRKVAIVLNVILLIIALGGLAIAKNNGRTLTYEDFLLPMFGFVLLLSLADTSQARAHEK